MRNVLLAASLALVLPMPVFAAGIDVAMDQVRIVTFATPVATVYVGNPSVADITMIDVRHAFVIGKGFGNTNIVALDGNGKQVFDSSVAVLANASNAASTLVVNRGTQRATYTCTASHCEAVPQPGDGPVAFDTINNQLTMHSATATKSAGSGQ